MTTHPVNLILFTLLKKRKKQSLSNEPMLIQIAILAWIFLGEGIILQEIFEEIRQSNKIFI